MAGLSQDKTVNRVAICSAIFAGFAYVGYSVVRQAFGRRLMGHGIFKNEDDSLGLEYEQQPKNGRVYLRRLSGSFASGRDIKLENLDMGQENGIIRPMAVLTRIRELNLGAKAFALLRLYLYFREMVIASISPCQGVFSSLPHTLQACSLSWTCH